METLGTGLALIVNGLLQMGSQLVGWHTMMSVALLGSLMYLAYNEVAELDRSSFKPEVERH